MKTLIAAVMGAVALCWANGCAAQSFDQVIVFGDSGVDSGYYRALRSPGANAAYNALWPSAVAAGAGAPTTNPGSLSVQFLASYFNLAAAPANQPGGTNYATSGAKNVTVNSSATGGFQAARPTTTQIANYLTAANGLADANSLYLISSGGNDIGYAQGGTGTGPFPSDPTGYVTSAASSLADSIASLQAAGARYILVDHAVSVSNPQQLWQTYSQALWAALTAAGVNFIPAESNTVTAAVFANPANYGFISTSFTAGQTACTQPAGISSSWALLCSSNPNAPSHLVSPNAEQTYLFADNEHFTTAGQKLVADYFYSLIVQTWGTSSSVPINGASYAEIAPTFDGSDGNQSFIRLGNNGLATTSYGITVLGSPSGTVYGTTTIQVPVNASPQYPLSQILSAANAGPLANGDVSYSLYLQDADPGLSYQHVIYNALNGFFENVSICKFIGRGTYARLNYKLANVHTSRLSGYPAKISVHNYSVAAATYKAFVYDAATGTLIGTVPVPVGANSTYFVPFSWFEQQLHWTPSASQVHANVVFQAVSPTALTPEVGQLIFNQQLSAYVSMTQRCSM